MPREVADKAEMTGVTPQRQGNLQYSEELIPKFTGTDNCYPVKDNHHNTSFGKDRSSHRRYENTRERSTNEERQAREGQSQNSRTTGQAKAMFASNNFTPERVERFDRQTDSADVTKHTVTDGPNESNMTLTADVMLTERLAERYVDANSEQTGT
ncbi:unnamed protein product, partial [Iphiclides podalirius]